MNRRVNEKMRRKHWKKWVSRALASFVVACACSPARVWGVGHDITATVSTWDNLKDEITKATQEKGEQSITLSADIVIKESITVPAGLQLAIYLEDWDTAVSRKLTRGPSVPKEKPLFDVAPGGYLAICGDGFVDGGLTGHTATDWKPTSAAATGPLVRVAATGKFFAGGVEIRNNLTKGNGGAIDNAGEAVLASCDIHHCHALGAGGGIYNGNTGTLLLTSEIKIAEADLPYSWSWGAITIGNRSFIKCCTAWGPAPENGKPVFGGYGGCLCNSGTATVVAWHLDKGCAYGGGCVANFATLTLKAMEDVAQTHLAWGKAVPCVAGVTAPDRWGEGNLLWNKGTCFFEKVDLRYRLADNEGIPDIFEYGRNPLTLMDSYAIPDPIPTGGDAREHPLTFAGFYYEDDPGWSTPAMWKWGVDESGADNDFCFFNTNGKTLSNTQNARVLANDMPLILGADGHAKVPGTDKIYENMSRYTNREFVVGVARGKEVTGTVSCMLFEVFSCKRVTPEPTVRAWTPQSPTGDSLTNLTPSPISGYSKETKLPEDLRQRYLVTIPDSVPPGSYWLVLIEQQQQIAQAIGCTHLYLADVRAPDISPRIVLKGSNTAEQIVMQNGVYTYEEGTRPVIYFIVTDESGFNELKGGVAKIVLQRPGTAQPLTMANCLVSGQSVAVSYPVTVPGIYSFVAVDYAGNISNAVAFNLKLNDGAGAGAGAGNIINNNNIQIINSSSSNSASDAGGNTAGSTNSTSNNNSNSSNQDSSNASENSNNAANGGATSTADGSTTSGSGTESTAGGGGTAGGAGTATAEEAAAAAKKKPDKTEFTFYNGKSYSNKTGNITPSKYISKQAFYNAKPGDVLLKARSDSAGESGVSEQELTKEDVIEATKKQEGAIAGVVYQISPAPRAIPNVNFADAPETASQEVPGATETETPEQKQAREDRAWEDKAWKLLTKQRNLNLGLFVKNSILTKAQKKNPEDFPPGTDLQILTFGSKKTLPEPYTFTAYPDKISQALNMNLPYELFEVNSNGTIVQKLGILKMKKGKVSWEINTHKNSYIIKEVPLVIKKNGKYEATARKSFEITMNALKKLISGSTKLLLNGADTMAVISSSSIAKSKGTGTLDLSVTKLNPATYGLNSKTAMVFDLADLGKLGGNVTLYVEAVGLGLGGKVVTIYGVNTQGKAIAIGTTTVSRAKEIAKITIKASVAAAIGKAKL